MQGVLRETALTTFSIGNTQGRGIPLRTAPVPTERGTVWPDGTTMQGLGSEREAYGWTWARVQGPDGSSGWMPTNFLIPESGSPAGLGSLAVPTLVPAPADLPPLTLPAAIQPTPAAPVAVQPTAIPPAESAPRPAQASELQAALTRVDAPTPEKAKSVGASTGSPSIQPTAVLMIQPTPVPPPQWSLAFDRIEAVPQAEVANETGVARTRIATGVFQQIFFRAKNRQDRSANLPSDTFTLTDAQGRTYTTEFQVRQVQSASQTAPFGNGSVVPGVTVALTITFDVARDATGLTLHMKGANSIAVE